MPRPFQVKYE